MSTGLFNSNQSRAVFALAAIVTGASLLDLAGVPILGTLAFPVFLLSTVLVCLVSWRVAGRAAPGEPLDLRLLDAGLIALSVIAVLGLLLGTAGWLSFRALILGVVVCAVSGGWLGRRPSPTAATQRAPGERDKTGQQLVNPRRGEPPGRPVPRTQVNEDAAQSVIVLPLILGLVAFGVVQAVLGRVLRPPVGDPLAYHLPFAVEWLQGGALEMPVPAAGDPSTPFYPLNSSLWIFWTLAPFESEILARYVQLPFLALLGLAVFRLGMEVGLGRRVALVAAALAVTVPDIARSASLPENDLILAALLVAATAYLARLWKQPTRWRAAIGALALGLAVGTKVLALPFVGLLGIAWLAIVFTRWRGEGARALGSVLLTGAGLLAALGGYSYLRNAVVMDNPLYPSGYVVAGREIFEGLYVMTWEWRRTHAFFPFDWSGFFLGMRRSFGWVVTWWALPGFALAICMVALSLIRDSCLREADDGASPLLLALSLLLWVPLTFLIFWFVIPYHFSRFLFPSIVWGIVVATWGLARLARLVSQRPSLAGEIVPVIAIPFLVVNVLNMPLDPSIRSTALYWVAALVVVGGVVGISLALPHLRRAIPPASPWKTQSNPLPQVVVAVVALALVIASVVWPFYEREYEERRFDEWRLQIQSFSELVDAWEWVDQHTAGEPAVIAVAGTNEIYPLYGQGLDNRIVTIWHSGELARYDWGEPFVLYGEPDREAWLGQIEQAGVDLVYITENVSFGGWPVEREWMMDDGGRFELAYENADVEIWAVRPEGAAGYTHPSGWNHLRGSTWDIDPGQDAPAGRLYKSGWIGP